jgi:Lysozyme like domain
VATIAWIDVAEYGWDANFRGEAHATAVALTQPESQRNPEAENLDDPNGGSFGLLQINGVHDPQATGTYPNKVPTQAWIEKMKNPAENMKAAFKIWEENEGFTPWGAFTRQLHVPWLPTAKVALDGRARIAKLAAALQTAIGQRDSIQAQLDTCVSSSSTEIQQLRAALDDANTRIAAALAALT